jgi:uncharacterized membrane protein YidH (DUF202 family)
VIWRLLLLIQATPAWAQTYYSGRVRNWNIPGGDTTIVGLFVLCFALTIWSWCRAVWVIEPRVKRNNFIAAAVSLVLAVALVALHSLRD